MNISANYFTLIIFTAKCALKCKQNPTFSNKININVNITLGYSCYYSNRQFNKHPHPAFLSNMIRYGADEGPGSMMPILRLWELSLAKLGKVGMSLKSELACVRERE